MKRRASGGLIRALLGDLENDVMQAVWESGRSSVEDVHRVVSRKRQVKEATTRTILRRLELKGYLRHEAEGRAYMYDAVEPPRRLAARAVRQIIDGFCRGSLEELVSGMVEADEMRPEELQALEAYVSSRRGERQKG